MTSLSIGCWCRNGSLNRLLKILVIAACAWGTGASGSSPALADEPLQKCSVSDSNGACASQTRASEGPTCGIEITCTDKPVQLGYSEGVCFRATCPGVWALTHKRVDQVSFRRRFITYRHYSFQGTWEVKDQGVIETGLVQLRELFLVLPDDLIELKLRDPDCNTAVEVRNVGYIKKGTIDELKHWLAYNVYLERPDKGESTGVPQAMNTSGVEGFSSCMFSRILSLGRAIGLPFCP
jgi:hypothetical protein